MRDMCTMPDEILQSVGWAKTLNRHVGADTVLRAFAHRTESAIEWWAKARNSALKLNHQFSAFAHPTKAECWEAARGCP